jgi:hypothetical protein
MYWTDDLLKEAVSRDVCDFLAEDSHHTNISATTISQNLFQQESPGIDISPNA